ncbi:MAG: hypothetical protein ACI8P9_002794 [Parasphingorhabdus sp.]|jgi:hypothetical protein
MAENSCHYDFLLSEVERMQLSVNFPVSIRVPFIAKITTCLPVPEFRPGKCLFIICIFMMMSSFSAFASTVFDHSDWDSILKEYVDDAGLVNYQKIILTRAKLDGYVERIKQHGPLTQPQLFPTENHRLAYYINAYNALVFHGVLSRGPEPVSVWSGLISGLNFFVLTRFTLDQKQISLKTLEDKYIRRQFKDPRIHAALNCASMSCPRLQKFAFDGDKLDYELTAAMQEFVGNPAHVKIDRARGIVLISKIFDWFDVDFIEFERSKLNPQPNLIDYINRYRTPSSQINRNFRIKFESYNKNINSIDFPTVSG